MPAYRTSPCALHDDASRPPRGRGRSRLPASAQAARRRRTSTTSRSSSFAPAAPCRPGELGARPADGSQRRRMPSERPQRTRWAGCRSAHSPQLISAHAAETSCAATGLYVPVAHFGVVADGERLGHARRLPAAQLGIDAPRPHRHVYLERGQYLHLGWRSPTRLRTHPRAVRRCAAAPTFNSPEPAHAPLRAQLL